MKPNYIVFDVFFMFKFATSCTAQSFIVRHFVVLSFFFRIHHKHFYSKCTHVNRKRKFYVIKLSFLNYISTSSFGYLESAFFQRIVTQCFMFFDYRFSVILVDVLCVAQCLGSSILKLNIKILF